MYITRYHDIYQINSIASRVCVSLLFHMFLLIEFAGVKVSFYAQERSNHEPQVSL